MLIKSDLETSLSQESDGISLAPLGLPGEALRREAALARIDALTAQQVYITNVEVFLKSTHGKIEYSYEGWEAHDYEPNDPVEEMKYASAEARKYVASFITDEDGEPIFRFTVRNKDVYLDALE